MWERVKRLFRSVFGGIIESAEDPELILKQTIRDMQDNVPKMRENVAQAMAKEKQLEKQEVALEHEIDELAMKVKAAIKQGRAEGDKIRERADPQRLFWVGPLSACRP